jgi:hypothetical protein
MIPLARRDVSSVLGDWHEVIDGDANFFTAAVGLSSGWSQPTGLQGDEADGTNGESYDGSS